LYPPARTTGVVLGTDQQAVPIAPSAFHGTAEPLWSELRPIVQILDGLIGDDEGMRAVWDNWLTDFNENSPCTRSEESGKLPE